MPWPRSRTTLDTGPGARRADAAARQVEFVFAVGSTFFLEIAKLRAARLLWAQAVSAFASARSRRCLMRITSAPRGCNKSVYDCYTNLLRVTTGSILGGRRRL